MGRHQVKTVSAKVYLWGTVLGYVSWDEKREIALFEYDPDFLKAPVEPSPLKIPKAEGVFSFPELSKTTFKGLPGLLCDSLPDKFGNALIDVWLSMQGRKMDSFNPVERLCYVGERGMGALEFKPIKFKGRVNDVPIEVDDMVGLASEVLSSRKKIKEHLKVGDKHLKESLTNLLVVGTSAGGARAKCIIALNEKTGEILSGQIKTSKDYSYWLLKLDGVSNNKDKEITDPKGFGRIEYAYYLMAKDAEIEMTDSRLLEENSRAHFMTKRFDRLEGGEKIHMQSLCAMAHYDFNLKGAYSYEQALDVIREVVTDNPKKALKQQFLRAIYNVIGRNQDDHTKNIAFLMDKLGNWSLSPAFDLTYSYNPKGEWTNSHQMSINGKRENFILEDLLVLSKKADLKNPEALKLIKNMTEIFSNWKNYAKKAKVLKVHQDEIQKNLRLNLLSSSNSKKTVSKKKK